MIPTTERPDAEGELALLVEQWTGRVQAGSRPDLEAFLADHPAHADELRQLLPALSLLGGLGGEPPLGRLGDYEIRRELGRGGMGVVYEAEQISLGRRVALKVLPFAATMDPRQLQRFHNEARAAAGLHHPHIVPVHAVGCERGVHFYAMQLIDGQTLAGFLDHLKRHGVTQPTVDTSGAAPVGADTAPVAGAATSAEVRSRAHFEAVARLGIEAAEALEHAHQVGVVHRDIKPANLILDGQGKLWVTDFGLARTARDAGLTASGHRVGTLRYMSPEQAEARHGLVDHRTDVYSLGVTLYELLTLRPAVAGDGPEEILRRLLDEEPPAPHRLNPSVPADLETVMRKAMAKSPADRYAAAQELADDLRRFLGHQPVRARRPSWRQGLAKWARRHRAPVVTAAVCAFLGLVAAVCILLVMNDRLRRAKKEAEENRQRSDNSLDLANDAMDEMTRQIVDYNLGEVPHLARYHISMLGKAVKVYQRFFEDHGDDPRALRRRAAAHMAAGAIYRHLNEPGKALEHFTQSASEYRELAETAGDEKSALGLAAVLNDRGRILLQDGGLDEAAEAFREAVTLSERWADHPEHGWTARMQLVHHHANLALGLDAQGRRPDAERHLRVAADLAEQVRRRGRLSDQQRRELFARYKTLASLLLKLGRTAESRQASENALALVGAFPLEIDRLAKAAQLHWEIGNRWRELGDLARSDAAYEAASAAWGRVVEEVPREPAYRSEHGGALNNLALSLHRRGETARAVELARKAVKEQLAALALRPELLRSREHLRHHYTNLIEWLPPGEKAALLTPLTDLVATNERLAKSGPVAELRVLAESLSTLAGLLRQLGRPADAFARAEQAVQTYSGFVDGPGATADDRVRPGYILHQAALAPFAAGRFAEARDLLRRATRHQEEALRSDPRDRPARVCLRDHLYMLGRALEGLKDDGASAAYRRCIDVGRGLARDFPHEADFPHMLGASLNNLATIYMGKEDARARPLLEEAVEQQRLAVRLSPARPRDREFLRNHYANLSLTLFALLDHAAAAAAAEQRAALDDAAVDWAVGGYQMAGCVAVARLDGRLPLPRREKLAGEYADRAVALLREAEKRGYRNAKTLRALKDFAPLLGRDDFQGILRRMEGKDVE